jgi:hypothetical protein
MINDLESAAEMLSRYYTCKCRVLLKMISICHLYRQSVEWLCLENTGKTYIVTMKYCTEYLLLIKLPWGIVQLLCVRMWRNSAPININARQVTTEGLISMPWYGNGTLMLWVNSSPTLAIRHTNHLNDLGIRHFINWWPPVFAARNLQERKSCLNTFWPLWTRCRWIPQHLW